jgi:TonB family protein
MAAKAPPRTAPPELTVKPLSELSRKPVPPSLEAALKRNYPLTARAQGKSGEAKVRARVDADGRVGFVKVTLESGSGFGDACRRTLLSSEWSPPLDERGRPVATWITYRCKFRIDD